MAHVAMSGRVLARQCPGPPSTSGRRSEPCQAWQRIGCLPGPAFLMQTQRDGWCRSKGQRLAAVGTAAPPGQEETGAAKRGRPKKVDVEAQAAQQAENEDLFDEFPKPAEYQQTLWKSLTLSGIGLHTGEHAYVRVRPAFAGEGRYFVRVADGVISAAGSLSGTQQAARDPELEEVKLQFFKQFMTAQETHGYNASFLDFLAAQAQAEVPGAADMLKVMSADATRGQWLEDEPEPVQACGEEEEVLPAELDSIPEQGLVPEGVSVCQVLGGGTPTGEGESDDDLMVIGSELLLAALEACGVDNARIEMEGGLEIPVLDGSALPWTIEIQFAGLRPAPLTPADEREVVQMELEAGNLPEGQDEIIIPNAQRLALRPTESIIVRDGDAFVSLVPDNALRLTVGIDYSETAEVIGKQWFSWCMHEDALFRFELADARQFAESRRSMETLREIGLLRGATESNMLVAQGDRWEDNQLVRHIRDEPARHMMVDLVGDLALNSMNGSCGLPIGHIVAYKPNHALNVKFLRALREATTEDDWVPMIETPEGTDNDLDDEGEDLEQGSAELGPSLPDGNEDMDDGEEGEDRS